MNSFGHSFRVTVFGESHGPVVGVVLDGVPAGIELCEEDFAEDIARRSPGAAGKEDGLGVLGTTSRKEADKPQILSGVFNGHTTGAPLAIVFENANVRPEDYAQFAATPRPGHADFVAAIKFDGNNDPRGGGHFAGRLTLPLVGAGVVAKKVLGVIPDSDRESKTPDQVGGDGITISSKIVALGGSEDSSNWEELIAQAAKEGDSLGGVVECTITNLPIGVGEPFWDSIESMISHAVFAIPGVRGIEFGDGFRAAAMKGSEHNDPFGPDGRPAKNGAGGINGGLTNGAPVVFRVAFKPTSSIGKPQETYNFESGSCETLTVGGRHDVCFARRCPVIVESVAALVLADLLHR